MTPGSGAPNLNASSKARTAGIQNLMQTSICAKIPTQTLLRTTQLGKVIIISGAPFGLDSETREKKPSDVPVGCSRGGAAGGSGNLDPGKRRHHGPAAPRRRWLRDSRPSTKGTCGSSARPGRGHGHGRAGSAFLPTHVSGVIFSPNCSCRFPAAAHGHSRSLSPGRMNPSLPFQRGR